MTTPNPKLPDICWAVSQLSGDLICIKNGETGYYPSSWSTSSREQNQKIADQCNQQYGITPLQVEAMVNGSMFGWNIFAADPEYLASKQNKAAPISDVKKSVPEYTRPWDDAGQILPGVTLGHYAHYLHDVIGVSGTFYIDHTAYNLHSMLISAPDGLDLNAPVVASDPGYYGNYGVLTKQKSLEDQMKIAESKCSVQQSVKADGHVPER